ncbi:MAG: diguanylate cyclase [bacterium]|nr:MAG: diguanylate cyclase [bacterium]
MGEKVPVIEGNPSERKELSPGSWVRESGFDGWIAEPVSTLDFLEQLSRWFPGPGEAESEDPSLPAKSTRKRVMVVDDDLLNARMLSDMLPENIYEVVEAYSGQQALEIAAASPPDVIFLDILMPGIDGFEVTRRLKADPETAHIPIVMVTSLENIEDHVHGLHLGAEDVLVKPVNRLEVLSRVRSMVRLGQYQKQLTTRKMAAKAYSVNSLDTAPHHSKGETCLLLVWEDGRDRDLFEEGLGTEYAIEVVTDAEVVLRRLGEKVFDLVFLALPDSDRLEILNRIRERDFPGSPQVVIITTPEDVETRLKSMEMGAGDHLTWPMDHRELQASIQVLLRKKRSVDSLRAEYQNALNSSIRDDLTDLYNRAYLNRYLELEVKRSRRHRYPVSLVMMDIDDFKEYNTRYGHLVGDLVIREVAAVLRNTFRDVDLVARFGGDEFIAVLPYCSTSETGEVVTRVCQAVCDHPFPAGEELVPGVLSISTGTATYPDDATTREDLIRIADERLLTSKRKRSGDRSQADPGKGP